MLGAICGSAISMDLLAQSMDPYSAQKSMDCADICGSSYAVHLKLNNFTHFNGPVQSTEQNHRPSALERLHGRRSRQVPAVILLLLCTFASHRTDTW